jgi:predicted PurR-regulated permease PerM
MMKSIMHCLANPPLIAIKINAINLSEQIIGYAMTAGNVFKACVVVLLTLLGAYILISSFRIIVVLTLALIIASAVRPLVKSLIRWRVPEGLAIVLVYFSIAFIAIILFTAVFPPIVSQLIGYIENDNRLANRIIAAQTFFANGIRDLTNNEVSLIAADDIRTNVANFVGQLRSATPTVINNAGGIAGDIILIFVTGVYWVTSRDKAIAFITQLIPSPFKSDMDDVIIEIETTLGNYVRGVVTIGSIVGLLNFIPMFFLNVPNALLIAMIIGMTTTIPMVGGLIGGIIAVGLTLIFSYQHAAIVLIVFLIVQQIENNVLSPRIMGTRVGLDPLLVIVYTSIGLVMGGVLGAFLAIPVMATVHVLLEHFVLKPYKEEVSDFETAPQGILLIKDRSRPSDNGILIAKEGDPVVPKTNGE